MKQTQTSAEALVKMIQAHGHSAWVCGDSIGAIEVFTKDGITSSQAVTLAKPTVKSVREWLGY